MMNGEGKLRFASTNSNTKKRNYRHDEAQKDDRVDKQRGLFVVCKCKYEYEQKYKYKYKYKQNDVQRDDDKWRRLIAVCSTDEIFV